MSLCIRDQPSLRASIGWRPQQKRHSPHALPAVVERSTIVQVAVFQAQKRLGAAVAAVMADPRFGAVHRQQVSRLQDGPSDVRSPEVANYVTAAARRWMDDACHALPDTADQLASAHAHHEALRSAQTDLARAMAAAAPPADSGTVLDRVKAEATVSRMAQNQVADGLVQSLNLFAHDRQAGDRPVAHGASRRVLRDIANRVASLMDPRRNPIGTMVFTTVTLPPDVARRTNAAERSSIIHRFFQEVGREHRRLCERLGLSLEFVYAGCMEIHEKAWRERGEVNSHWHAVFRGRATPSSPWFFRHGHLERILSRVIYSHTGIQTDCSAAINLQAAGQRMREEISKLRQKDGLSSGEAASNALTRYLSKGSEKLCQAIAEAGHAELLPKPGHKGWSVSSQALKQFVEDDIRERSGQWSQGMLDWLERHLEALKQAGLVAWFHRLQSRVHEPTGMTFFGGLVLQWVSEQKRLQVMRWCRDRYLPPDLRDAVETPRPQLRPLVSIPPPAA